MSPEEIQKQKEENLKRKEELRKTIQAKNLIDAEISEEMRKAYIDYSMSVIVSRALPSAEDGLKKKIISSYFLILSFSCTKAL